LVKIEINDLVWQIYEWSMALGGSVTHEYLIKMLEIQLWEESANVIGGSLYHPESYEKTLGEVSRAHGASRNRETLSSGPNGRSEEIRRLLADRK
jgi:hypothetical protein